jgi:hypothetical protein
MKKICSVFFALLVLLSITATPAFAAGGNLVLRETRNDPGGGVIFVFEYTGDFTEGDFKGGSVLFNGQYYPLDCNIAEGIGEVWCTASRALAGQYVQVFLAGFTFWDRVPERRARSEGGGGQICYEVWYWEFNDGIDWFKDPTSYCQDAPANYGDIISLTAPPYIWTDDYYFWDDNQADNPGNQGCGAFVFDGSVTGDAYYEECVD